MVVTDCAESPAWGGPQRPEVAEPFWSRVGRERDFAGWGLSVRLFLVHSVTLSYKLKLFPTANKADTLSLLAALFARLHTECTAVLCEESRCPSTKGRGEFVGRAYRRAFND